MQMTLECVRRKESPEAKNQSAKIYKYCILKTRQTKILQKLGAKSVSFNHEKFYVV